jgi:hypothetical protein
MLDLLYGWSLLLSLSSGNAHVFIGQVEVLGIGVLKAGSESRLPSQPLEEAFQLCVIGIEGRFAQSLARLFGLLLGKLPLECNRLFGVKRLEVFVSRIFLEPSKRLRSRIYGRLAVPLGFLQVRQVLTLDSFLSLLQVTVHAGLSPIAYLEESLRKRNIEPSTNL